MATITANAVDVSALDRVASSQAKAHAVTWDGVNAGDECTPIIMPYSADKSIQVEGTFGTMVLEGSNDGVNYRTLNDPSMTPLSFSAAALKQVLEVALYIRPRATLGGPMTATMVLVRKS